jgi:lipopolysaccharide export system permease protein
MGRIPRLTELVISKGVPATEILLLFGCLLPTFFSITVPLSFLLGILLAFGRLSADSEYVALKASGVSLYALFKPVLLLAVGFSLLTAWTTISIEPAGKTAFRSKLFQIASSRASVGIQPGVFNDDFSGIVLYSRSMDERRGIMQGVFISDARSGETPATILAQEGRFLSDPEKLSLTLRLTQGNIHRAPIGEKKATFQTINFSSYDINLPVGQQLADEEKRYRSRGELSWRELQEAAARETSQPGRNQLLVEKHKRVVIAFAPLVFALVGVPLGLQSQRSGKGAGFSLALAISLVYYLLLSIASTLAGKGAIPAGAALWLPNLCFLLGGSYFIHRTAVEQPLRFLSLPARIFSRLQSRLRRQGKKP